jgi:uncharacterized protein
MDFEWDPDKAAANLAKHGIGFHEAATVFDDPLAYTFTDPDHSFGELRLLTFGVSAQGRLLVVSHRENEVDDTARIISARGATRAEKKIYEENN